MMDGGRSAKEVHAALNGTKSVASITAKYWRLKGNDPKAASKRTKQTKNNNQQDAEEE